MTNKEENTRMELHEFQNLLNEHIWSWECKSFYSLSQSIREEQKLSKIAWSNGPYFVEAFIREQKYAIEKKVHSSYQDGYAKGKELYEANVPTGDEEFDAFREQVLRYDFWWSYSDDARVCRHGQAAQDVIEHIVATKGGIYKTYWKYFCAKTIKASEESIKQQQAEKNNF